MQNNLQWFHANNHTRTKLKLYNGSDITVATPDYPVNAPLEKLKIYGDTKQSAIYSSAHGHIFQDTSLGIPTPIDERPVIPYRPAGRYKRTFENGDIYEFDIPEMNGDFVRIDEMAVTASFEKNMGKFDITTFTGQFTCCLNPNGSSNSNVYINLSQYNDFIKKSPGIVCNRLSGSVYVNNYIQVTEDNQYSIHISLGREYLRGFVDNSFLDDHTTANLSIPTNQMEAYFRAYPYYFITELAVPVYSNIALTKVTSSAAPELPCDIITGLSKPSPIYPFRIYSASNYNLHIGQNNINITDELNRIEVPADSTDYTYELNGKKYVSDYIEMRGENVYKVLNIYKYVIPDNIVFSNWNDGTNWRRVNFGIYEAPKKIGNNTLGYFTLGETIAAHSAIVKSNYLCPFITSDWAYWYIDYSILGLTGTELLSKANDILQNWIKTVPDKYFTYILATRRETDITNTQFGQTLIAMHSTQKNCRIYDDSIYDIYKETNIRILWKE